MDYNLMKFFLFGVTNMLYATNTTWYTNPYLVCG